MPENQTFFRAMASWTGYRTAKVSFDVQEPRRGKSRWSTLALFKLALGAITSYSSLPMQVVTGFGIIFFIFSVVLMIQTLVMKLSGRAVEGFTTVILLLLIIGSVIMFSLGVIGLYLSRIYNEIKRRPRYLIDQKMGFDREDDA
jgi:dolichol-phosphate mannosyltransferase